MGTDIVDDLHAAEDFAETLRLAARAVIDARSLMRTARTASFPAAQLAFYAALAALDVLSEDRFVRPGCETEDEAHGTDAACIEGEDCGGYHSWQHEDGE